MPITNSNVADKNTSTESTISAHKNDLAIIQYAQYNSPQPQVDPHPSSGQYHEVYYECTNEFSPTDTCCFSSLGSANITECAQKLREVMEDDPEEEVGSALEPGFVHVNEHRVKVEYAPLVRAIFERYGDITIGSHIKSPAILSWHLEYLCVI